MLRPQLFYYFVAEQNAIAMTQEEVVQNLKEHGGCLIRKDTTDSHFTRKFQIRQGQSGKMFTLRQIIPTDKGYQQDLYCGRLSNDFDKAVRKAANIALTHGHNAPGNTLSLEVLATRNTRAIRQRADFDKFPFGKYKGKAFSEVDDNGYKQWLYPVLCQKSGMVKTARALRDDMLQNGFQERNEQLISPEQLEKERAQEEAEKSKEEFWQDLRDNSRYLNADIGYKTPYFRAFLLADTSFDTQFGRMFIQTFVDDQKRVYVYKGKEALINSEKGEPFLVRGTVKDFDTYNGICQTRLSNLTVLDRGRCGLCGDTAARWAKSDGYSSMAAALENPSFVEDMLQYAHDVGNLPKKDWNFARSVIKEVLQQQQL